MASNQHQEKGLSLLFYSYGHFGSGLRIHLYGTRVSQNCLVKEDPRAAADKISAELSGIGVAVADKSDGFQTFGITDALEAIATMVERTVDEKLADRQFAVPALAIH
ncbi:hypothetical protein [Rhizobium sp. EC-SD404]|uniref:hypothetical protein n=1 Tax=Rhizobium sp. EC-SD404 TaxID=2038389 RepID=UPI00125A4D3C|nr:hypothetical protein [Rhizobium sp. EC-SD404]VVT14691.1 hypothetical protein RHIZ404_210120 [Rhizobium sp. EC-SD404]